MLECMDVLSWIGVLFATFQLTGADGQSVAQPPVAPQVVQSVVSKVLMFKY